MYRATKIFWHENGEEEVIAERDFLTKECADEYEEDNTVDEMFGMWGFRVDVHEYIST